MRSSSTLSYNHEREDTKRETGHVVFAVPLKDRTPLQSAVSRIRTWTPYSPPSTNDVPLPSSPPSASPRLSHSKSTRQEGVSVGSEGQSAPLAANDENEGLGSGAASVGRDQVVWGGWDELDPELGAGESRKVLLMAYASSGISMWDSSTLDSWYELLNIPSIDAILPRKLRGEVGSVVGCSILPAPVVTIGEDDEWAESRPLLAVLTTTNERSRLLFYSLKSHSFINNHVDFEGLAHSIKSNRRFLIISTSTPLSLHILSSTTFAPAPFSPLTDLVPSPFDGSPIFDLGKGGRILTYATDRSVPLAMMEHDSVVRSGMGLLAQRGMFDGEDVYETSGGGGASGGGAAVQISGEVARKVGEGVMSGVKAIGDLGFSYWASRSPPSSSATDSNSAGRNFSKSAPLPSVPGFERRSPTMSGGGTYARTSLSTESNNAPGTVIVVDLLSYSPKSPTHSKSSRRRTIRTPPSPLKVLAHYRPYASPLSILSLSPSSSHIFTSSSQGNSFDIFELKPNVAISDVEEAGKVWHRYRLQRGFTTARTTSVSWTSDMRFVSVGTGKGTTHVYAIQPFGGKPDLESHFGAQVANTTQLQPLSVSLSTIARIRSSISQADADDFSSSVAAPSSLLFLSKSHSLSSSIRPTATRHLKSPPSGPTGKLTTFQDLVIFYPRTGTCVLERLSTHLETTTAEGTLAAASRGDVGRLATTAVSGLSQLMKSRGGQANAEASNAWVVTTASKAEWNLARQVGWKTVTDSLDGLSPSVMLAPQNATNRYSAAAEIETFSRSPHVLPRSIYLSQQFDFYTLPSRSSSGRRVVPPRRLEVRSEVQLRQGPASPGLPPSPLIEPTSLDQPIRSAMQTILDSETAFAAASPRMLAPTFPNGVPGRQGTWRDAIPIRAVAPSVNEGLGRVRRELHRVRANAAVPRRRASSGAYSSSISFEDDESYMIEHSESGSTACTSEQDGEISDDACWGLHEEPAVLEHPEIPFEDDFDDFSLQPPTFKVDRATPVATLPVPILVDDISSSGSSLDPSPTKESHLIEIDSPLSVSPSSQSSGGGSSSSKRRSRKK